MVPPKEERPTPSCLYLGSRSAFVTSFAERGIAVSYETVRRWVNHFGPMIAAHLRKRRTKTACDLAS